MNKGPVFGNELHSRILHQVTSFLPTFALLVFIFGNICNSFLNAIMLPLVYYINLSRLSCKQFSSLLADLSFVLLKATYSIVTSPVLFITDNKRPNVDSSLQSMYKEILCYLNSKTVWNISSVFLSFSFIFHFWKFTQKHVL